MDSNKQNEAQLMTVVLGDEFDDALRARLMKVLQSLGAMAENATIRSVAGSQELEEFEVTINGEKLRIEAETYIGLAICGSSELVQQIAFLTNKSG